MKRGNFFAGCALALLLPLAANSLPAADGSVVFSEIMYRPATNESALEWVELHSLMTVDMDLAGWSVTGGIEYTFPEGATIRGGGFLVLARNPTALAAATGLTRLFGPFTGRLSNSGEQLELRNLGGRLVDVVSYGVDASWPAAADGAGSSLAKRTPTLPSASADSWMASLNTGGSPGQSNATDGASLGGVRLLLNEVSPCGDPAFQVEIFNGGTNAVPLDGYRLVQPADGGGEYRLPAQPLPPGEFLAVSAAQMGFALIAGDLLVLYAPGRNAVMDAVKVGSRLRGRYPDGGSEWLTPSRTTFGRSNVFELRHEIVINEIMYHPPPILETPAVYDELALVPIDSLWRYSQAGVNLEAGWRQPDYNDDAWPQGRALFYVTAAAMPAPKNTPLTFGRRTYYFRSEFQFDGSTNGAAFTLHPIIDDGAVFYLNGSEVLRVNMPGGTVSYGTYAFSGIGDAAYSGPFVVPAEKLVPGVNVLAVEVHQAASSGNDIVFGVELRQRKELAPALPFRESSEQWIELCNRGPDAVDLTGWRFNEGIQFQFPDATVIPGGGYLVVAKDVPALQARHPEIAITGPFEKQLSRHGERIVLQDTNQNPVDVVHYHEAGQWPSLADGGGASLELRDSRADNDFGEAWAASDESRNAAWREYRYRDVAAASFGPDAQWREFVFGLLDEGEVLLDDISVVEDPDGARTQMLPNTAFTAGLGGWRILGNHHGTIIDDPDNPGNQVLRLVARGPAEHWSNHAETTLANQRSVVNGRTYEISFRAKWMAGCPKFNTRLYFNRLARTTTLDAPARHGTPGAANSARVANLGPVYEELRHSPAVPEPGQKVTVSVRAGDPDGIMSMRLWWSVNEGAWSNVAMTLKSTLAQAREFSAAIPGQAAGSIVQFYITGVDSLGAASFFPAAGPNSRALFKVNDQQANVGLANNLRVLMLPREASALHANTNLMSNDQLGCTVIYNEREVFYECGVRLRGTCYSRPYDQFVSFSLYFPPDHLFRGVHASIDVDRSGRGPVGSPGQDEILIKHLLHRAGILCEAADLIRVLAPLPRHNSSAMLYLGHYSNDLLDSAYPEGGDSTLMEWDGAYYPTRTTDGKPESPKVVEPGPISYTDLRSLGEDKEAYRWNFIPHNNRLRDDYPPVIALAKAFELSGAALDEATRNLMDVSQWLRVFAALSLCGVTDAYTMGNPHNLWLYVRPGDERILALPHDWDVAFARSETAPLAGDQGNLLKIINLPANQRVYYRHLRELINTTWNQAYIGPWADHYDNFLPGQNFSGIVGYITRRGNYVLSRLPGDAPFAVTSNHDPDLLVNETNIILRGTAPLEVQDFLLEGAPGVLPVTWINATNWQVSLPLLLGLNHFTLVARGYDLKVLGTQSIRVTSTASSGGADRDGDGMPDAWESAFGLSAVVANAREDDDGDGMNDRDEYLAGTHPLDPGSSLQITWHRQNDGPGTLGFLAVAGRAYALDYHDTLAGGGWVNWTNFSPVITNRMVEVDMAPGSNSGQRIFRLLIPAFSK